MLKVILSLSAFFIMIYVSCGNDESENNSLKNKNLSGKVKSVLIIAYAAKDNLESGKPVKNHATDNVTFFVNPGINQLVLFDKKGVITETKQYENEKYTITTKYEYSREGHLHQR